MAITLAMVSAALASAPFCFAGPKDEALMKLSEIKTGMRGIGRTVVSGYDIEEFDVEVLGILKNSKLDEALQISGSSILVRVSGEVILKSGGIAA
ncbi:MAG TPA: peptidase S55 SpoIVB, partial [Candidatus Wallbacteria bacterium]|nr:peptidase S55 SpoIVB [Candidatus Wallbacteria bacterium]